MSDVVLALPLDRSSLVEASAGTGKTYALAGLFARAVIIGRLRVPQVLAVTYTVAATQELHARVRARLRRAAELAAQWRDGDPAHSAGGDNPETALLRGMLHAAQQAGESLPALRLRLRRAVREMDLAAITTIHGFCQRVLGEHALATAQPLVAATLQPDNTASRRDLALGLWREFSVDEDRAGFLRRAFGGVDELADALRDLLAPEALLPPPPAMPAPDPRPALRAAWKDMCTAFASHGAQAHADIIAAIDDGILKGNEYKAAHADGLWSWLHAAMHRGGVPAPPWHDKCAKYTPATLRKGTIKKHAGRTPHSPLFEAMATLLAADEAVAPWCEAFDLQQLHRLRERARVDDAASKQAFNVRSFDDLVGAVFDALADDPLRARLVPALRAQFPLVLVDEFQDTDARQWAIFECLFGTPQSGAGGLVLVGDPKQAIYGFRGGDVHTYLQARASVAANARLASNFRSRPCLLRAIDGLFEDAPRDALGHGIAYVATEAGDKVHDADYRIDGQPAPALVFHVVPPRRDGNGQEAGWNKDDSIAHAAALCAQAIRDRLLAARQGTALLRDHGTQRALQPRDCAVLVRTHGEAVAVRMALARLGVPAVAAGRQSLFATDAAQELLTLLLGLSVPGDGRRLRAALATRLLGLDAHAVRALDDDGEQLRAWQQTFAGWRQHWLQHGPQAMLADVVAQQASRLLALADGERLLTHLLQLGELMQQARAQRLGVQGQLDWLRAAIDNADDQDETQWPRLESDASRVQILTLHASKGLEFPLVFLPFAGVGRGNGGNREFVRYHDDSDVRVRQWHTTHAHPGAPSWPDACARAQVEDREEDMRLLYVGLTRARHALWLCGGALANAEKSALARLLGGTTPQPLLAVRFDMRSGLPDPADSRRVPCGQDVAAPPARTPQRRLYRDWWIHSFSQLHRQRPHGAQALVDDALADGAPAADERPLAAPLPAPPRDPRFVGERFGNVLHHALEHAEFAAWRDRAGDAPPPGQDEVLRRALRSQDYRESDLADGVHALAPLVAATLNAPLLHATRLCDLPPQACIAELEFHFVLDDVRAEAMLALLHAHDIVDGRRDFGAWPRLAGLMTGKIDLVCRIDGRLYVIDYKSNVLADYDDASVQAAMAAQEYDLQALLYAVAVHRWLRLRLGDGYDFDTHFGGVRYLFCRGLDADAPGRGIAAPRLPRQLLEAVDALFTPAGERA